jgi:diguanylate cyclase (GGDEF)-like protein/PAS domain S-box-containing protein
LALAWLALFCTVILLRVVIRYRFFAAEPTLGTARRGSRWYVAAVFVTASVWGLSGSVVLVSLDPLYQVMIVFVLAGMMAGGILSNAPFRPALVAFLVPTMLPLIVMLLIRRSEMDLELAGMVGLFSSVVTLTGVNINKTIVENVRLRIKGELFASELRASASAMAEAQAAAHIGSFEFDPVAHRIECTAEIFRIFGLDPAKFDPSYETLVGRVHPEDRAGLVESFGEFERTGKNVESDCRILMDDGTVKYLHTTGHSVAASEGRPMRFITTLQDVTEQTTAANELKYRDSLLHAVTTGTAILLESDAIEAGMPQALKILGESMRLDRVGVVQLTGEDLSTALRYEWHAPGVPSGRDPASFTTRPSEQASMAGARAQLAAGNVLIGQRADGPGPLFALIEYMELESVVIAPVAVDHKLWGIINADSCHKARVWTANEIDTMKTFAGIAGSVVARNDARILLETSEERFRVLSTTAQDAIVMMDERGLIRHWNRSAERILGYSAAEVVGKPVHELMVPARFQEEGDRNLATFLATGEGGALGETREFVALRKDGAEVAVEVSLAGARIGSGWQAMGILRDVSARREADAKLQFANMLLKTEMEASPDGILVVGPSRNIMTINQSCIDMWALPASALKDAQSALAAGSQLVKHREKYLARVEYLDQHRDEDSEDEIELIDGRTLDQRSRTLTTPDGTYLGRVWYYRDISARKGAETHALRLAHDDVLTGLANRSVFVEALARAIAQAKTAKKGFGVIYLDLDRFKDVNDSLGHPVGDELLQAVAERLRSTMRDGDTIARFGGDEFAVIVSGVSQPADAALVADRLSAALAKPFSIRGNDIRSGASFGIDIYGPDSAEAETLLSHADVALYQAKAEGRGCYRFFTEAMGQEVRGRVTLGEELRAAVSSGQLFLLYQPQVQIDTGRIMGLEALVRWHHPQRGTLEPDVFIPVAERTGVVAALGEWVLHEACRHVRSWLDDGVAPVRVALIVSRPQFKAPLELERDVTGALAAAGVAPAMLEIELKESVLMDATLEQSQALARLRDSGVSIAIDDFGTGYSSLGYLRRFPVDRIKIPQDFVRDLGTAPGQAAIAKATIGLARDLGIAVIAEGVVRRDQVDALRGWGCEEIQGPYYSKPLDPEEVARALRNGAVLQPAVASA